MKRRLNIILILAVTLAVSMLVMSGCNKHNNANKGNAEDITSVEELNGADGSGGSGSIGKISDNVITWGVTNPIISDDVQNAFNQELYAKGYDFSVEFVPFTSPNCYDEKTKYENKHGTLDICSAGFGLLDNEEKPLELVKSDYFLPLDEMLKTEEGKTLVNLYDEKLWDSVKVDGITYTVPNGWQKNIGVVYAFNKNLISEEELKGFHGDLAELEPYMDKISKKEGFSHVIYDMTGNFIQYIIPCDYRYGLTLSYDGEGASNPYQWKPFRGVLNTLHDYYKNGYINYNLSLMDSNYMQFSAAKQKMLQEGNFFVYITMDFKEDLEGIGSELLLYKTPPYATSRVLGSTGIAKNSKHQKEAFTLLTLAYTDEALANLLVYGIEGTDYQLKDGKAYAVGGGETNEGFNQYALGIYEMTYPNAMESFQTDRLKDKKDYFKKEVKASPYISFNFYDTAYTATEAQINQLVMDNMDIWKSDDMDAEYDRVNTLLKNAGIDKLIDAVNKQWKQSK